MTALRIIAAIALADLRQRLRVPRTWVVLVALAIASWWSFPPIEADYLTVSIGGAAGARAHYSSAWIGLVIAAIQGAMLSLAGFYVVRGTVVRDLETGAWQLLVATPMNRAGYLLAKWCSHMAVFALLLSGAVAVGVAAQLLRDEVPGIDLVELLKPVALVALPALGLTATLAVWFDLVPWLRRTAGNVVFFFVWVFLLAGTATQGGGTWMGDPQGMLAVEQALAPVAVAMGGEPGGLSVGVQVLQGARPVLFDWTHWDVGAEVLAGRGFWMALAVLLLLAATPLLDRFAAHRGSKASLSTEGRNLRLLDAVLAPLRHTAFGSLVAVEAGLALRPHRWRWFAAMALVFGVQAFAPEKGMAIAILVGWLLCMDLFGRAVLREHDTRTAALVFTAPGMRHRLLVARVVVGVGLAWLATLPALVRLGFAQPEAALAVLVAGASVALWGAALGALFRNARPYELLLVGAAYASVQGALVLNVLVNPDAMVAFHAVCLPLALGVLATAWRQLVTHVK